MARGQINGKKILVTGFRRNNDSSEEIYKVTAFGTSTAEASAGSNIESNSAVVLHEKHAWIRFAGNCDSGTLCNGVSSGCMLFNTKNIVPGTLSVSQYPSFIESYRIEEISESLYRLEYCRYPSYGGGQIEKFIVSGIDIYGNTIYSDGESVAPQDANQGTISLYYSTPGTSRVSVSSTTNEVTLYYELSAEIKTNTVSVGEITGNITGTSINNEGYSGMVTVKFPANNSQSFENTYKITIKGKDIYNDIIYSNEVTITQGVKPSSSQFYITGNDIEYDQETAVFVVHYPNTMDPASISVVDRSSNISNIVKQVAGGVVNFIATTGVNDGPTRKELSVIVTGRTGTDGTMLTISGLLFQGTGAYILISGETDYPNTDAGQEEVVVQYYTQSLSFKYTAFGVSNVSASGDTDFTSLGGTVSINKSSKTVSLRFPKNETNYDRVFTITVYGTTSVGNTIRATYTFTHIGSTTGSIRLVSGTSTNAEIEYNVEDFQLTIYIPADVVESTIGVADIQSTSQQYRIYRTALSSNNHILTCFITENTSQRAYTYTVVVSGATENNIIKYSNEFTVLHKFDGTIPEPTNVDITVTGTLTQLEDGGGGGDDTGSGVYNTYFWGSITTVPACAARPYDPDAGVGRAILVGPTGATVTMNVNVNPEYRNYLVKWGRVNQGAGISHGNPELGSTTATLRAVRQYGSHFMLSLVPPDDPVEASAIWAENITVLYDEEACGGGGGGGGEDPGTDADYSMGITTGAYRSGGSYCPGLKGFYADSRLTSGTKEDLEIDPSSWVVTKKRLNQRTPDPVSFVVSNSVNNDCEFWICSERYNSVIEIHNTGGSSLNIHGYGFKNMVVNESTYTALYVDISATTIGGKHIGTTIMLPAGERSYISDSAGDSVPYICPQSGGVVTHSFYYDNIDEESFSFIPISTGITNIEVQELGIRYADPGGGGTYYKGILRVTLAANQEGMSEGYDAAAYKYFTITGTSTLDGSEQSCRCSITQELYSYANFPYPNTSELNTYDPNTSHGLLIIPLEGLNLDTSRFSYRFCDHLSTKSSTIYLDDDDTIDTLVKDDNTTYENTVTFGDAIPITMEYGSININGNQIEGYYLTMENQAWRIYDAHGGRLIELTFYDNAGNSWKNGLAMDKNWSDGSVTSIIYRDYSHGWYS